MQKLQCQLSPSLPLDYETSKSSTGRSGSSGTDAWNCACFGSSLDCFDQTPHKHVKETPEWGQAQPPRRALATNRGGLF